MKRVKGLLWIWIAALALLLAGCGPVEMEGGWPQDSPSAQGAGETREGDPRGEGGASHGEEGASVTEDGEYQSKDQVAEYIHLYGHLPGNFISKTKARELGWDSKAGNLQEVAPGKSIGGSRYKNYDGALPEKEGRIWTECDIDYEGGYRGAKRILFSNDGLIYYTDDHYETFTRLY